MTITILRGMALLIIIFGWFSLIASALPPHTVYVGEGLYATCTPDTFYGVTCYKFSTVAEEQWAYAQVMSREKWVLYKSH